MGQSKVGMIIGIAVVLLCGSHSAVRPVKKGEPTTALLGAFAKEIILLQNELTERQERRIEGMKFVSGKLSGRKVVVAWTGVGKVNAAMTTTLLIEHYRPQKVIFTGIAGGLNPELSLGDIVIGEKAAHHDMGTYWPEGFTAKGVRNPFTGWENPIFFEADERLLELAERAAGQVKFKTLKTRSGVKTPKVIKGTIVTGDVFVASEDKCAELRKSFKADAVEMEGAAVAQICFQQKVGCLVIRSISDKADEKAREDMGMFHEIAAINSSALVVEIVGLLDSAPAVEKK